MNTKTFGLCLLAASLIAGGPAGAGAPPSAETPEEILWSKVSQAADQNLASQEARDWARKFVDAYPAHPKAARARYLLAEREFRMGKMQAAAAEFERFLADYPKHPLADSAAFRLAEAYYNTQAYNSAFGAWERVVRDYKHSQLVPDAMQWLTALDMRSKEWGKADEEARQISRRYPSFYRLPQVRKKHGVTLYYIGDYNEGAKLLEGIDGGQEAYYRGLSLFALKLFEDSVAALKNVDAGRQEAYLEPSLFLKAEGFFQNKNYNLAALEFGKFGTRFPDNPLAPYADLRLAACALFTGDPAKSIQMSDRALKRSSDEKVRLYGSFIKASACLEAKQYDAAAALFAQTAKQDQFPELAAVSLAREAWARKNLAQPQAMDQCLKDLERRFPASPQMAMARFLEGAAFFEQGRWEDAAGRFETGLIRYPYSMLSEMELALMAVAYTNADKLDQLVTAGSSALKIVSENYSSLSPYWRAQSYFFIGKAYFDLKRYAEAAPFFDKVVTRFSEHPLAPRAQLQLAWSLLETGDYAKAREKALILAQNEKADPDLAVNARFLVAASRFNAKEYDKALTGLSDFVKASPKSPLSIDGRYLMGLCYLQKKVYGSAIDEWTALIREHPAHPLAQEAHLHIGSLYFKAEKFADAAKFYKEFRERWPESKYAEAAFWQETQAYYNAKNDETLIQALPVYIQKYPHSASLEDAKKQLELVYYRRGANGDPDKLAEFLSRYPQSAFAPAARYKLGDMAMEQKKWSRAAIEMEQFVSSYPGDPLCLNALYALGLAYESLGEQDKAITQYRHILDQFAFKPNAVDAAFHLGTLFYNQEKYKEALEVFQLAEGKKMAEDVRASLYYNIALCQENLARPEDAARAYLEFVKYSHNPDQTRESLMTAGLLLKKIERFTDAADCFKRLLKDAGSKEAEIQAVNLLAECYLAAGKENQALQTYERLIGMEPVADDKRLAGLAQLAYLLEQKKATQKAIGVYEKIAMSQGKQEWVAAAQKRIEELSKNLTATAMP